MPDHTDLQARPALYGLKKQYGSLLVEEITETALVTLAHARENRDAVSATLSSAIGAALPDIGHSSVADDGLTLLGLQQDQTWCVFTHPGGSADRALAARLGETSGLYLTDQSDGWCVLSLTGDSVLAVLERLCSLDLHEGEFKVGHVARTAMEHTSVIMLRLGHSHFQLMSPRSSAGSFAHAIDNAATHVHKERLIE